LYYFLGRAKALPCFLLEEEGNINEYANKLADNLFKVAN